jgi:hypothetical protein
MIASAASFGNSSPPVDRHASFTTFLLPRIVTHARIRFRYLKCRAQRDEAIQECVSLAWRWYARLWEIGKDASNFPVAFVCLVVKAVKSGRRLCGQERAKDVLSPLAQRSHGFTVEPLPRARIRFEDLYGKPHAQEVLDVFEERLSDNTVTPPPDAAAFRIDWPAFFASLPARDRALATFLSLGHSGKAAATKFGVSQGRVTQLRQKWRRQWRACQGDDAATEAARAPIAA